jgi:hypothetical protein
VRRPAGIPPIFWLVGIAAGLGAFAWLRKRSSGTAAASPATAGKTGQPAFSQAQEVQDFQIFSSLTGAQEASDLNFLSEVAGLFGGQSSGTTGTVSGSGTSSAGTGTASTGTTSPASTGSTSPTTVPASQQPGYGAGISQLKADNPGIANAGGISGETVSYNGVPV